MKFEPVIRLFCWIACPVLAALSFGVMGSSVIGGLLMLCAALWLCPACWRAIESLTGKAGSRVAVAVLAVPLFLLGLYVANAARKPEPIEPRPRFSSEAEAASTGQSAVPPLVDTGALNFFRHIMAQDYLVALAGGQSALNALAMVNPVERMSSSGLASLYDANAAASNRAFKGRRLIVTGQVLGMRISDTDKVVLELPGADRLFNVQAQLHSDPHRYSAPVVEGQHVELYCTLYGKVSDDVASNLYLEDCSDVDFQPDAEAYASNLTEALSGWLHSGGKHIFPSDQAAAYFLVSYLAGTRLPSDSPCLREETPLEDCLVALEDRPAGTLFEKAYGDLERWRDWLGLPAEGHYRLSSR
ncbi:hypothetical protein [Metapseudomonas resinovorans]|uniref:Uncharacterized protein n=1 Tax=Metapseudomonas resinovorans NBRC 106553 TaxID=1245471 RepID=S6AH52_METRE|nr:hypothetical protein [Pseudomonas resinovorans]BAN49807.1 hypothetical protein PCA10_40750 [Pseudomonas resinovorans NBRC 106553]